VSKDYNRFFHAKTSKVESVIFLSQPVAKVNLILLSGKKRRCTLPRCSHLRSQFVTDAEGKK
jgi:hypothetical protein